MQPVYPPQDSVVAASWISLSGISSSGFPAPYIASLTTSGKPCLLSGVRGL